MPSQLYLREVSYRHRHKKAAATRMSSLAGSLAPESPACQRRSQRYTVDTLAPVQQEISRADSPASHSQIIRSDKRKNRYKTGFRVLQCTVSSSNASEADFSLPPQPGE
ncbi:hypothetical protein E2C01_010989 [Portunus trituberculatus]|uniref:Uncharacterized protein n=1 Tax=Portunus trituberculatus TaxID=210409 RepID=A0A5B7DAB9_PORTR|nr:hypothetical protein [Portunus trituberculatus]